jgi:two-component system chemotaxis sensor kinase CheA
MLSALTTVREEIRAIGLGRTPTDAGDALRRLAELGPEAASVPGEGFDSASDTELVRVPQPRLDPLISTTSDLWVQHAQLVSHVAERPELRPAVERLTPVVRRLQSLALSVRLQAFRPLLARIERLVREDARRVGKEVFLEVEGASVEVDKGVLDACSSCLVHLVRNAIAHGLETPDERVAAGKNRIGRIKIAVTQQAGLVRVLVADDGRGLDPAAIRAKAEERGLDPRRAPEALIFEPNFSTAKLGELAGRGVGLDAVRSVARAAGGTVEVVSTPGGGCCFTLILPASLALQRALLVEVGGEMYAFPAASVFHTARTADLPIRQLGARRWVDQPGRLVPFVDASSVLGVRPRTGAYSVLFEANGLGALEVDRLAGHQELVFRSLENTWVGDSPVSGATLASSGDVLLRLDPSRLVASAQQAPSNGELQ